ncbi:OvmZ protein [Streptomyces shenzhenensis]|uniref:OvmZ protein n=1 Tax=Streptomyces shenzhenensis TaxID=943815 RepID=UPI001F298A02|nr:OvmZ protein [Streptomyces shenzhenensis]
MREPERLTDGHASRDCHRRCGRICVRCLDRIDGQLRTLLDLYRESDQALVPGAPVLRERVSGSRATVGIVLDERVLALRARTGEVMASWARLVVDERTGARPAGRGVPALVGFLRGQLPWFAGHPAGVDLDEELAELRTDFRHLLGPGPVRRFALGPCTRPGCAGTLHGILPADGGDRVPDQVTCDTGHALPPRQWLLVAGRIREVATT